MKASEILEAISKLDDQQADLLLIALDDGMNDEWDCGLDTFFRLFWHGEFKIAAKSGMYFARAHEED